MNNNITWHKQSVTKEERRKQNGYESFILWFTGLSGSGKSTLANAVGRALFQEKMKNYVLDGDNIRHGLNKDLDFTDESRKENIRRIGEVAKLFVDSGTIVLTAFISPFIEDRETVRSLVTKQEFIEVYVKCDLDVCENRDPKGLYKLAREGKITNFTGINSPYEYPLQPEITIETDKESVEQSVEKILNYLRKHNYIS